MGSKIKSVVAGAVLAATTFVGGAAFTAVPAHARTTQMPNCREAKAQALSSFYYAIWYGFQIRQVDGEIQYANAHMATGWQKRHLLETLMVRKGNLVWMRNNAIKNTNMYNAMAANCR